MDEYMTVLLDPGRPDPFEFVELVEAPVHAPVPDPVEVRAYPDDSAAWAVTVAPGPDTATVLEQLDPVALSAAARVDALVGFERLIAWAHAGQTRVLAAMADDPPPPAADAPRAEVLCAQLDRDWVREDVRAALGESGHGARARLHEARELAGRLPDTLCALAAGRIGPRHAAAITDSARDLDDTAARQVEAAVCPSAPPDPPTRSCRSWPRCAADYDARWPASTPAAPRNEPPPRLRTGMCG